MMFLIASFVHPLAALASKLPQPLDLVFGELDRPARLGGGPTRGLPDRGWASWRPRRGATRLAAAARPGRGGPVGVRPDPRAGAAATRGGRHAGRGGHDNWRPWRGG